MTNLFRKNNYWTALVLTVALLLGVVGLGLYSVYSAENGGYEPNDLTIKQAPDNAWYTYEKDYGVDKQTLKADATDLKVDNYTGVASNEYGWWRVENGKVNFKANGIYANEYGYWYVKNGKVQFGYTGYLEANYYVHRDNGSPLYSDEEGTSLKAPVTSQGTNVKAVSTNKAFWRVKKGKLETGYTGAKSGTINKVSGWWRVESGRVNQKFNSVAKNEYGWWYFKNGRVDFNYTGVAKNDLGWWRIEDGKVNFNYNGIASNEYGSWYLEGGKVDFSYSGAIALDGTMYVIEKGKVVLTQKLTIDMLPQIRPNIVYNYRGAELSWAPVKGVTIDGYELYVKNSPTASWSKIATLDAKTTRFTHDLGGYYDPTLNTRIYDIRAVKKNTYGLVVGRSPETKQEASNNFVGGSFFLAPPDIVSVNADSVNYNITFKKVPYATDYVVSYGTYRQDGSVKSLVKAGSFDAENCGAGSQAEARAGFQKGNQTVSVPKRAGMNFITVQAVYTEKNAYGKTTYKLESDYDTGFKLNQTQLSGKKVLFLGDSLMVGTPYGPSYTDYQISTRVGQQTGASVYNAAVGGAVLVSDYPRVINNSILHNQMLTVANGTHANFRNGKWTDVKELADFDIVVLEGGPNDYSQNVPLGSPDSTNVAQFYGALNKHMELLKEASQQRMTAGKAPIRVVLMDLYYSPQGNEKNRQGLTYRDYSAALQNVADLYAADPDITLFFYETKAVLNEDNVFYETVDRVHFTAYRYGQAGNDLAEFLKWMMTQTG